MLIFNTTGTLGDTYVYCCKFSGIKEDISLLHRTLHHNWHSKIREIYSLVPNIINIKFCDNPHSRICDKKYPFVMHFTKPFPGEYKEIKMNFFPQFEFKSDYKFDFSYIVIQPKSGRKKQKKELPIQLVKKIIRQSKYKVVLVGTSKKYEGLSDCINLINKTSLMDSFKIIQNAKYFIGFFGILTMVALSNRVSSNYIYIDEKELKNRVYGTPWEKYSKRIIKFEDFQAQISMIYKIRNMIFILIRSLLPLNIRIILKDKFKKFLPKIFSSS